jgi:hypothetical protein
MTNQRLVARLREIQQLAAADENNERELAQPRA